MILYENEEDALLKLKILTNIDYLSDKFPNTIKAYSTTIPNPDNIITQQHVNNSK